ncbi:MAG: hypothetical protein IPI64_08995 [Chloracidobacterium sp.]|nr:hypothetical protein [Chloracidobacterium sp.]
MTKTELIDELDFERRLMIEVATGKARIEDREDEYRTRRRTISEALKARGMSDFNPYPDLWDFYSYWKNNFPTYQERREYVSQLFRPVLEQLNSDSTDIATGVFEEPTGWDRVDRGVASVKLDLKNATNEEEFQGIGLLCREILISVAQCVFNPALHSIPDVKVSATDTKRMLEAYFAYELSGQSNEAARRHAKASLDLTNTLQHKRTANFRDAAFCAEATTAVVNIVAILAGRRDRPELEM